MTIHWKDIEQYFTVVLFVFHFYPVCNFVKFVDFELSIVMSERVKELKATILYSQLLL